MFVITGVTGNTGKHAALALIAAGKQVRVVVRDAAKGAEWKARGAEVAIADVADEASLTTALTGATAAYVLLPPPAWGQGGLVADRAAKIAAIAGAVNKAKPAQVVMLSSIGADQPSGTGPILDLRKLEAALTATGVPTTFLRAAFFMDNWGSMLKGAVDGGALYYGSLDGKPFAQVATEDIGKTAAKLLQEAAPRGTRVVELAGPADYTFSEVAAALAKATGKPVKAVTVPIAAVVQSLTGMGASQEFAEGMGELTDGLNKGLLVFHRTDRRGDVTLEAKIRALLG